MYTRPLLVSERAVDGFLERVSASFRLAALVQDLDVSIDGPLSEQKYLRTPLVGLRRATRAIKVFPTLLDHVAGREVLLLTFLEQTLSRKDSLTQSTFRPFVYLRRLALYGGSGISADDSRLEILTNLESLALYDSEPGVVAVFSSLQ